jgi:hypothetical protein
MLDVRRDVTALRAAVDALPRAPAAAPPNPVAGEGSLDAKVDAIRADLEFVVSDLQRLERKLDDLSAQLENRGTFETESPQPPELDWTQDDLFETARKGAASVGYALTRDELRCPAQLVLQSGLIEYLVALKGTKLHETLFSIVGDVPSDARRPRDMGVKLNNALQALGFRRGTPIRFGPTGTAPAQGQTVHLYVEWTTGGVREVVRAEDLVWHTRLARPMRRGSLVYVGSLFVPGDEQGSLDFAADLTAEVVATYSAPSTIIDNVDEGAQDDTVFVVASPRIPKDVLDCTLIFRRTPLDEATLKEFPEPPPAPAGGGEDEEDR